MSIIDPNLVFAQLDAEDETAIMTQLADALIGNGNVVPAFKEAVIAREKQFPTGLPSGEIGVAIPHTEVKYVKQPAIAFASLAKPIDFVNMADKAQKVKAQYVVMLAMKQPHSQVALLQQLMGLFQEQAYLRKLLTISNSAALYEALKDKFVEEKEEK